MGRLEGKHWVLIAGFLAASATMIAGLHSWSDVTTPAFVAGFLGQLGVLIGSVFVGAPQDPKLTATDNPARRATDPVVKLLVVLALLPAMLLVAACGGANPNPNVTPRSPVAQVAIEGDAVIKAADAVLTGLDRAMEPTASPRLPPAIGLQVVKAIREVGVQGQNLAATLTVIQATTDPAAKATAAGKARQTLSGIRLMLTSALSPIKDAATKNQVSQLLVGLVEALDKAQQIVDAVKGGGGLQLQPAT